MNSLKLYSYPVCPFAQRTRIALLLKGIECETVEIDLGKESEPWFLELNPEGSVPTLVHEGRAIYESNAVNEYLDEVFSGRTLFPKDPWKKAISRIFMDFSNRNFNPLFYGLLTNQDRSKDQALMESLVDTCRYLNDRLLHWNRDGVFLWNEFGMADLTFAPFFKRLVLLSHYRGFKLPESKELARFLRWRDALVTQAEVLKTSLGDHEYIRAYESYARGLV